MQALIQSINSVTSIGIDLPFAIYRAYHEQRLFDVPVAKPTLVVVINGSKQLGKLGNIMCNAGEFVFLSDSPKLDMRNIPKDDIYQALLIEFDANDFTVFERLQINRERKSIISEHYSAPLSKELLACITQFVDSVSWANGDIIRHRKQEILLLLHTLGFEHIPFMTHRVSLSNQIYGIFKSNGFQELRLAQLCSLLAMSESTLRRKLQAEDVTLQQIKDKARLGHGLHLLQATSKPIGDVASLSGYTSQSRFTEKFKSHFGITPSELRSTKLKDMGENLTVF
ncbi:helix-turn-helix transcriptional regulator [Pseudoalteromonas sp. S16_S37]|uniref:helix-turn-helix transcriptional regulator n=1 Tax=Pseudoalteromonas sp. S16_S37 TaxID=2720228 RepID=UPI00168178D8|nr:helix-turn-helix transcriptional regulator [Pseudoalteromonas sp. S16_S37]MBD1583083.1 helix-turn-helix transcriptional regulator [Pseudoalteromonas sp. S16_S37]